MSAGSGEDFKEQVRSATNIVDLISETVSLTAVRGGVDYVGLCPFHDDKNPSFHVYPDRQSYRCWVCDAGGDCFRWVMDTAKVSFREALEQLAERARIEIPTRSPHQIQQAAKRSSLLDVTDWAVTLMEEALQSPEIGRVAREYIQERGLSEEIVKQFRIGFHPENWSWFLDRAKGRFQTEQLQAVGLVTKRDEGDGYFDNLVGRLVFPIADERGRPVAFGGRVLPKSNIESPAKYWNSPESAIFLKRRTLYGLDIARKFIKNELPAIVVEGYMDAVACHQANVRNVVATLGTALTEDHVRILKRFTKKVVLVYDGDEAGKNAAEKSIQKFIGEDIDLRILSLSDGMDPDDYFKNYGIEEFQQLVKHAPEAWEYKLQRVTERFGVASVSDRLRVVEEMVDLLSTARNLTGTLKEDLILKGICEKLQVDESLVRRQLQSDRNKKKGEQQRRERYRQQAESRKKQLPSKGFESAEEVAVSDTMPTNRRTPTGNTFASNNRDSSHGTVPFDNPVSFDNAASVDGFVPANSFGPAQPFAESQIRQSPACEKAELELLEIILSRPEMVENVRYQIGPEDIEHPRHRRLFEICLDLVAEEGLLPETNRVISAADSDSSLVSLINRVLDSAQEKGIGDLLDNPPDDLQAGVEPTPHLQRVLQPLILRRNQTFRTVSKQKMAQAPASSSELHSDQADALRQLTELRKREMGIPKSNEEY